MPRVKRTSGYWALDMVLEYTHLMPDQKREAVTRMERDFEEGGGVGNGHRMRTTPASPCPIGMMLIEDLQ